MFYIQHREKNVLSIARSLDRNSLSPGVHAITGKLPKYAIQYEDTKRIKTFLLKYAADNALPLPERPPNYKTTKYYYCLLIKALLTYIKNINLLLLKCITEVLVWELSKNSGNIFCFSNLHDIIRKCCFQYVWTTTIHNRHALKSIDQD